MDTDLSPSQPPYRDDDKIDLMRYVLVLWRYSLAIAATTLVCGIAVYVTSSRARPLYEATAQLAVNQSKVGDGISPPISMASFKALVDGQSIAAQVLQDDRLDQPPYNFTVSSFLASAVTSTVVRDTNVIAVKVRLPDPALAAKVANRYLELAVQLSQRLSQDESGAARDFMKVQLEESRQRLSTAEEKLERFKKDAQVDLVREDVEALLGERGRLVGLTVEIESERARLAAAEQEFSKQGRVRPQRAAADVDDEGRRKTLTEPGAPAAATGPALHSGSPTTSVAPAVTNLDEQIALSRTKLAGLEQQQTQLMNVLKLGAPRVEQLTQLYAKETELSRLDTEFGLAKSTYMDVATRYEQARLQVASHTAQLQVLDAALPPDYPVSPQPRRATMMALTMGLVLSTLAVLLFDAIITARRTAS